MSTVKSTGTSRTLFGRRSEEALDKSQRKLLRVVHKQITRLHNKSRANLDDASPLDNIPVGETPETINPDDRLKSNNRNVDSRHSRNDVEMDESRLPLDQISNYPNTNNTPTEHHPSRSLTGQNKSNPTNLNGSHQSTQRDQNGRHNSSPNGRSFPQSSLSKDPQTDAKEPQTLFKTGQKVLHNSSPTGRSFSQPSPTDRNESNPGQSEPNASSQFRQLDNNASLQEERLSHNASSRIGENSPSQNPRNAETAQNKRPSRKHEQNEPESPDESLYSVHQPHLPENHNNRNNNSHPAPSPGIDISTSLMILCIVLVIILISVVLPYFKATSSNNAEKKEIDHCQGDVFIGPVI